MKTNILNKLSLMGLMLLCSFVIFSFSGAALAGEVILVEDYDDANPGANSLNYWTGGNPGVNYTMGEVVLYTYQYSYVAPPYTDYSENNKAMKFTYDCLAGPDTFWYASNLWDGVTYSDISGYEYLSFKIKGEAGGEDFYIQIQYGDPIGDGPEPLIEIHSSDYFTVTDEWQHADIPLSEFTVLDKTKMRSISVTFHPGLDVLQGTLYLNNLAFSNGYAKPESYGPVKIDRATKQLMKENPPLSGIYEPFYIKGVGYQTTPIGNDVWPPAYDIAEYDRDFPLLVEMGCNTIRTWGEPGPDLMAKAEEYGLMVIVGFWIDSSLDFSDYSPGGVRETIKTNFTNFVDAYDGYDSLLMWAIGNECNYSSQIQHSFYYSLANELAEAAYQEVEGDTYHPVMIVNGKLHHIGVVADNALDIQLDYLDAWGSNLYTYDYDAVDWFTEPQDIFEVYKAKSAKPLVITEYGADAFHTESIDPIVGYEDETKQAEWVRRNTLDIMAASDVCLGSTIMAYADGWWKYTDWAWDWDTKYLHLSIHDRGPASDWHGHLPDSRANEEYWGIMEIALNGTWDDGSDGLDDVMPRQVYYELQKIFVRADFTTDPTTGRAPLTVSFTDESTGEIAKWEWDFDGDGAVDRTDTTAPGTITHEYTTADTYTVTLTVTGPGDSDITTGSIIINLKPSGGGGGGC